MTNASNDLHGNAPDSAPVALLIIDMINDLEFPEGPDFFAPTLDAAERIADLKRRAKSLDIPVIYANDNFGRWRSDFNEVLEHCLNDGVRGQPLAERLRPDADDYWVLKPKSSAFFATTLETLLNYLNAKTLIITGISADACVLFTANDAYVRDYNLYIPQDCVVAALPTYTKDALAYMKRVLKANTTPSTDLNLDELLENSQPVSEHFQKS
ncbi:cysteine hydrolase family protein [Spirosoma utsteinense]|uniref:Nicotinamidase-related amidase n=1 Tax=Spirosoma utsteinense TaxID=2585773 RepID=A0ABR6W1R9_9BACT|nr:isochorismatase family cysteine hydrolase [Spirosoma utsteinense]MBC3784578.1 nicotinamidase-related amidase [Spirosoma utsteinense]MBC3789670.1 nicotinamidase-related amidase [Spirosoma utsteinense]